MKFLAVLLAGLLVGSRVVAATPPAGPFLCIVEQSTGFTFDNQTK
jgi:hypothetical protein